MADSRTFSEAIPMTKRIYRAVEVKKVDVDELAAGTEGRLILGCDAAKEKWYGVWMNEEREVLRTMRWDLVDDCADVLALCRRLRQASIAVDIAVEPTGTYADAMVGQFIDSEFEVYSVSAKHAHDYQEIYDGVPSGHDAKSAAIVAKLHLERGAKSRRWKRPAPERRELRVAADELDWFKQDEQRYLSRLESRVSRYWPELTKTLELTGVTAVQLLATYGGPDAVAADAEHVQRSMWNWSRGNLSAEKIAQVVASASSSIGVPMVEAERQQVQKLAATVKALRRKRKEAERALQQQMESQPQHKPIAKMVGVATAGVLLARVGDLRDFGSVRALYRAVGLNLREHSSGKKKGQLTISKRGSSVARRWLFMAALRWLKTDKVAGAWYKRKHERSGGAKLKAVVALMRKLLAALYHVARGEKYDPTKLFDCRRLQLAA
jgi:transposase